MNILIALLIASRSEASLPCSEQKMQELLAPASDERPEVALNCQAVLRNNSHQITKKILFKGAAANGALLDCMGSRIAPSSSQGSKYSITVRSSKLEDGTWSRPVGVVVRNCKIQGSIRVYGMAPVSSDELKESSRALGHTERMQAAAPQGTRLENLILTAVETTPLYFSTGVTHSVLLNSEIKGKSGSVAVYLDAESSHNTLKGNYIHVESPKREQVAVDGSAHNRIVGNRFASLKNGGIYLYRNCGERGVVRHQPPQHNQIINNIFEYGGKKTGAPSVWVGSRSTWVQKLKIFFGLGYCKDDRGFDFGSSQSNKDHARHNAIAENQVVKNSASKRFRQSQSPNYYDLNESVEEARPRRSGCFTGEHFLRHGQVSGDRLCQDNQLSEI